MKPNEKTMKKKGSQDRINAQNTRYSCYLNPISEYDFSRCPKCDSEIKKEEKLFYLIIEVNHQVLVTLNVDCQFCQGCGLIIVKQPILESWLRYACEKHDFSELIGTDYSILGLTDKENWKKNLDRTGTFRQPIGYFNPIETVYGPLGIIAVLDRKKV